MLDCGLAEKHKAEARKHAGSNVSDSASRCQLVPFVYPVYCTIPTRSIITIPSQNRRRSMTISSINHPAYCP